MLPEMKQFLAAKQLPAFIYYKYSPTARQTQVECIKPQECSEYFYCSEEFCGCEQFLFSNDCIHLRLLKNNYWQFPGITGHCFSKIFEDIAVSLLDYSIRIKGIDEMTARLKIDDLVKGVGVKAEHPSATGEKVSILIDQAVIGIQF